MTTRGLLIAARILLGSVFFLSGILKLLSPDAASGLILHLFPVTPTLAKTLTVILSVLEIAAGAMLVLKKSVPIAAMFSTAFLLASIFVGVATLSDPVSCGCFGALTDSKTDEFFLLRNAFLFLISMVVLRSSLPDRIDTESAHAPPLA